MGTNGANGRKVIDVAAAVEALPPLPAVALRVMQVAQDPRSSASDLAIVISSDPGLSARMLRVVNSAAHRRTREITSVQDALVMLGFVQARNIAISGAIAGSYSPDKLNALFRIDTFWRHSVAVAFRTSDLAGKSRQIDVPSAFTAGILHNMGRLAVHYADPAALDQAVAAAMASGRPLEETEAEMLGYDHTEVGARLAQKWHLPEEIREGIRQHHTPESEASLGGLLAAADRFCTSNGLLPGYTIPPTPGIEPELAPEFVRLMKQVDVLVQLVTGNPAGVRAA